jgi:hypothetical protein
VGTSIIWDVGMRFFGIEVFLEIIDDEGPFTYSHIKAFFFGFWARTGVVDTIIFKHEIIIARHVLFPLFHGSIILYPH